jgi:hypothetical protein
MSTILLFALLSTIQFLAIIPFSIQKMIVRFLPPFLFGGFKIMGSTIFTSSRNILIFAFVLVVVIVIGLFLVYYDYKSFTRSPSKLSKTTVAASKPNRQTRKRNDNELDEDSDHCTQDASKSAANSRGPEPTQASSSAQQEDRHHIVTIQPTFSPPVRDPRRNEITLVGPNRSNANLEAISKLVQNHKKNHHSAPIKVHVSVEESSDQSSNIPATHSKEFQRKNKEKNKQDKSSMVNQMVNDETTRKKKERRRKICTGICN